MIWYGTVLYVYVCVVLLGAIESQGASDQVQGSSGPLRGDAQHARQRARGALHLHLHTPRAQTRYLALLLLYCTTLHSSHVLLTDESLTCGSTVTY